MRRLALGCALLLGVPAAAAERSATDEGRVTLRYVGECVVGGVGYFRDDKEIRELLAVSPYAPAAATLVTKWASKLGGCAAIRTVRNESHVGEIRFHPTLLRGAVFRGLYRQQFGRGQAPALSSPPSQPPWRLADDAGFTPLQQYGECVAQADPVNARAMLFAIVASEEEKQVYAALAPTLSRCLMPGVTIRFSKALLEGLVAEGLYHLAGGTIHLDRTHHP